MEVIFKEPVWIWARFSAYILLLSNLEELTPNGGSGRLSLTLLPDFGILFLLMSCPVHLWYEGLCLVLLQLIMPYLVAISGRSSLFWRKIGEELMWGREEVALNWEEWREGKLQPGYNVLEKEGRKEAGRMGGKEGRILMETIHQDQVGFITVI